MLTNICIDSKSVLVLTTKLKLKLLIYCKETLTHFNIWERKLKYHTLAFLIFLMPFFLKVWTKHVSEATALRSFTSF